MDPGTSGGALRLVIVDDAERSRELLRRLAEHDGRFEVVGEAGDGADALAVVASTDPDVVLLDVRMPVMDGIEALVRLKALADAPRIVMYSADSTRRDEALVRGADAWVDKTDSFAELAEALADRLPPVRRVIDVASEEPKGSASGRRTRDWPLPRGS